MALFLVTVLAGLPMPLAQLMTVNGRQINGAVGVLLKAVNVGNTIKILQPAPISLPANGRAALVKAGVSRIGARQMPV